MFSQFTTVDRNILKAEADQVCPYDELETAMHRCMNDRNVFSMLASRIVPHAYCAPEMEKYAGCRIDQMKYMQENVDAITRTMMFREAVSELKEAREKGKSTARPEEKIDRIRQDFKLILEAKKLAKAPPVAKKPEKPDPQQAQLELIKKLHDEEKVKNEKLVDAWRKSKWYTKRNLDPRTDEYHRWI